VLPRDLASPRWRQCRTAAQRREKVATINAESKAIAMCRDAAASRSEKGGAPRWRSNATRSTPP
jgi:hypothetical protein